MRKILALTLLLAAAAFVACSGPTAEHKKQPQQLENPNDTPTEAYKRLYAAVKSKDTEAIRKEFSTRTRDFAKMAAARQKVPESQVLANGFTATTFSPTLPEIRDERIKDDMGAIEVWNSTDNRWEDLPFIREKDGWKIAIGDQFANTYRSPGKGLATLQNEATNSLLGGNNGQKAQSAPGAKSNVNRNANINLK